MRSHFKSKSFLLVDIDRRKSFCLHEKNLHVINLDHAELYTRVTISVIANFSSNLSNRPYKNILPRS